MGDRSATRAARAPARSRPDAACTVALWAVLLSPAVVLPGGLDRFVLIKTLAIGIGVAVGVRARPSGRLPRWAVVGLAAGAAWLLVTALGSAAPWAQVWGRWPRYEGLVTLPAAVGALWVGARTLGPGSGVSARRTLARATLVVIGLVGGVALAEALGLQLLSSSTARSGSLLGNASEQGIIGVVAAAVLLPVLVDRVVARGRHQDGVPRSLAPVLAGGAGLALAVTTVVLSGSRGALLGLVVAVLTVGGLMAVPAVRRGIGEPMGGSPSDGARRVGSVAGVATAAVLMFASGLALLLPDMASRLTGTSPLASGTIEGRRLLWSETLRLVADHPETGVGPSGFVEAIPGYHTAEWAAAIGPANPPDSPHSWPLQAAAAGGIPLLLLAVGLAVIGVIVVWRALLHAADAPTRPERGRKEPSPTRTVFLLACAGVISGYLVAAGTHFTSPGTTGVVALLAGGAIAAAPRAVDEPQRGHVWVRRVGIGALAAWLAVLLPAVLAEWPLQAAYRALDAGEVGLGEGADAGFRQAQTLRPWDGDVAVMAAHAFATTALAGATDAVPAAERWAARALARVPGSAVALAAAAATAEASGDLDRAEEAMTTLIEREPFNPEWLLRRGVTRAGADNLLGAEADFLRAAELSPSSPGPWRNLHVLYRLMGRESDAAHALEEADARSGRAVEE